MRRLLLAGLIALVPGAAAMAQTPQPTTAPRNPSVGTAGLTSSNPAKATNTVESIDHKLLSEEKDRPSLPNQAPSPSKGGTAMGAVATTPPH